MRLWGMRLVGQRKLFHVVWVYICLVGNMIEYHEVGAPHVDIRLFHLNKIRFYCYCACHGHGAGRSPCAHSIGKFFLCSIVLFSSETSAPGSPGNYLYIILYILHDCTNTWWYTKQHQAPSTRACLRVVFFTYVMLMSSILCLHINHHHQDQSSQASFRREEISAFSQSCRLEHVGHCGKHFIHFQYTGRVKTQAQSTPWRIPREHPISYVFGCETHKYSKIISHTSPPKIV